MKLTHRHRNRHRAKAPRVAISQAEITADLLYPAPARASAEVRTAAPARRR
jgi:hypothetical protein